jgi:hypothetical protein
MLTSLLLVFACSGPPDPDARLRAGDLDGAAAAWQSVHGVPLDIAHPAAVALAARAPRNPAITTVVLAATVDAVRFLDKAPATRTEALDLTFDRLADLGAALDILGVGPTLLVVGRSRTPVDPDPYTTNADLPWRGGRLVGFASGAPSGPPPAAPGPIEAFGATVDANPPAKLVTFGIRDGTGHVYMNAERQYGIWVVISASNARVAARLLLAADSVRDYGAATLRERRGRGVVHE